MQEIIVKSFDLKIKILNAFNNGEKQSRIAHQKYYQRGHLNTIPKTMAHTDKLIKRCVDPWKSGSRIISEIDDLNISETIVRQKLIEGRLFNRRPTKNH